jgi:hypothetical protein
MVAALIEDVTELAAIGTFVAMVCALAAAV